MRRQISRRSGNGRKDDDDGDYDDYDGGMVECRPRGAKGRLLFKCVFVYVCVCMCSFATPL
jgi:hypothetical protein